MGNWRNEDICAAFTGEEPETLPITEKNSGCAHKDNLPDTLLEKLEVHTML